MGLCERSEVLNLWNRMGKQGKGDKVETNKREERTRVHKFEMKLGGAWCVQFEWD